MSRSNTEEIIGILWFILSLMLFDRGYGGLGRITLFMGIFATVCSIVFAYMQRRNVDRI